MRPAKTWVLIGILALALSSVGFAQGKTRSIRAAELSPELWAQLDRGELTELIVEFRQGDHFPVKLQVEGDFLGSADENPTYVSVKRAFWIKLEQNDVQMSLDGQSFKAFKDVVSGSFTAGASSNEGGGYANAINLVLKAVLK